MILSPFPSGSLRTSQGALKHIVARVSGVYAGPLRQTRMVGIPGTRETHPRHAHLLRQIKGARIACAVMVANLGIVEHKRNLSSMECARAIIQHMCAPRINVSVGWRRA
jgi:hypothetical protein